MIEFRSVFIKLIENSDEEEKLKWCRILAEYEYSFFNLSSDELNKALENMDLVFKEMRINIYYQANRFFLEDNQIIKNIDSIKHLPISIVHGSRDLICPPDSAFKLHKHLSNSTFVLVPEAGHLSSDPKIQQALIEAVNNWR